MKTFRYELGHVHFKTMSVSELREKLNEYPQDMPVIAKWEGTWHGITEDFFEVKRVDGFHADDVCDAVFIDVEF